MLSGIAEYLKLRERGVGFVPGDVTCSENKRGGDNWCQHFMFFVRIYFLYYICKQLVPTFPSCSDVHIKSLVPRHIAVVRLLNRRITSSSSFSWKQRKYIHPHENQNSLTDKRNRRHSTNVTTQISNSFACACTPLVLR